MDGASTIGVLVNGNLLQSKGSDGNKRGIKWETAIKGYDDYYYSVAI